MQVAEIELQDCKEDGDNEDWAKLLFPDTVKDKKNLKASSFYLKIFCKGEIEHKKEFLKEECFKFSTNTCRCRKCINYADVWDSPVINTQTSENKNRYNYYKEY